jgi:SPP1 family predicted phage head-tail adaptor
MALVAQNFGTFDRLITPRYPAISRGTMGGVSWLWASSGVQSWAKWLPQSGREFVAAASRHTDLTGILRIRYRNDIAATWRVLLGGVLYDVTAVLEVGRKSYLDLLVKISPEGESVTESYQTFEVTLDEGDIDKAITYPTAFASSPTGIYVALVIPSGGYTFTFAVVDGSRDADGCTIDFGAAIPAAGYKLSIQASL